MQHYRASVPRDSHMLGMQKARARSLASPTEGSQMEDAVKGRHPKGPFAANLSKED